MPLFTKPNPNLYSRWGYSFIPTPAHTQIATELEALRHEYDTLADRTLEKLLDISSQSTPPLTPTKDVPPTSKQRPDLYNLLQTHHASDPILSEFWAQTQTIPPWVDWAQIKRGQKFFSRYVVAYLTAFVFQAFLKENFAAPGVMEVIARTGGFNVKNLLNRAVETFTWMVHVLHDLESLQPGGKGHIATVQVRLLHATMRLRILKLASARPSYYSISQHGIPAHHHDGIHAIVTFCTLHIFDAFPRLHIPLSHSEEADFTAVFRYIAYLLGTPDQYFDSPEKAKMTMEALYLEPSQPTKTCWTITLNVARGFEQSFPRYLSRGFLQAGNNYLNGDEFSKVLGLGKPSWYYRCVFVGLVGTVSFMARVQHLIPSFDRYIVEKTRQTLYNAVTTSQAGKGFKFEFKYVPELGKRDEEIEEVPPPDKVVRPMERFFFGVFVVMCLLVFLATLVIAFGVKKVVGILV